MARPGRAHNAARWGLASSYTSASRPRNRNHENNLRGNMDLPAESVPYHVLASRPPSPTLAHPLHHIGGLTEPIFQQVSCLAGRMHGSGRHTICCTPAHDRITISATLSTAGLPDAYLSGIGNGCVHDQAGAPTQSYRAESYMYRCAASGSVQETLHMDNCIELRAWTAEFGRRSRPECYHNRRYPSPLAPR